MECIDNKIKGKIIPTDPRDHRQYKACLQNNPIAKIVIPNSLYYDWEAKIKLQRKLHCRVSTYADLLNFSLARTGIFSSVNSNIECRLKREFCKIRSRYTELMGTKKTVFKESGSRKFLLFEKEVCFHSQHIEIPGMPYTEVRPSTQQRKLALIKAKTTEYLKGLGAIGLKATMLTVETGGEDINIKLGKSGRRSRIVKQRTATKDTQKALLHTLMVNNVSFKVYHEIASLFPSLPRAYEIKKLKKEIKTTPITSTKNNEIEGAECDFVELLTEAATDLVSLHNADSLTYVT
ncbi:uncharacterized protein [Dysidea avara]|uniref:uncharacterized protein n=1 Tax=Dysidea avara TaxID=196820 RepID=UPI0033266220